MLMRAVVSSSTVNRFGLANLENCVACIGLKVNRYLYICMPHHKVEYL